MSNNKIFKKMKKIGLLLASMVLVFAVNAQTPEKKECCKDKAKTECCSTNKKDEKKADKKDATCCASKDKDAKKAEAASCCANKAKTAEAEKK